MKLRNFFTIFISIFLLPIFAFAASSNVFSFSTYNNSIFVLLDSSGNKVGYDGVDISEEIDDSEVFLNGDFLSIKIDDIENGDYKINLENSNTIYEKTVLAFNSQEQNINQRVYFFLDKKNQIKFKVTGGKMELGANYSLVKHLRLKKNPEWKISWEDDNVDNFKIYGRKDGENNFKYITDVNAKEYVLTGAQKDYKEYAVTKIFDNSPHTESGILPNVLGAVVFIDDADEDGISDSWENVLGTDKDNADTDGDGIEDTDEILETNTDPKDADSDDDGVSDGDEKAAGTDPNKKPASGGKSGPKKHKQEEKKEEEKPLVEEKNEEEKKGTESKEEQDFGDKQKNDVGVFSDMPKQNFEVRKVSSKTKDLLKKQEEVAFDSEKQKIEKQKEDIQQLDIRDEANRVNQKIDMSLGEQSFLQKFFGFWSRVWHFILNIFN